jgi:hypothetical protein
MADKKGFKWDGKSRVSTELYKKNFNKIFGVKNDKDDERERFKRIREKREDDVSPKIK